MGNESGMPAVEPHHFTHDGPCLSDFGLILRYQCFGTEPSLCYESLPFITVIGRV
jgi:hypothetical protein